MNRIKYNRRPLHDISAAGKLIFVIVSIVIEHCNSGIASM
jgi:hypothetical protein